MPKEVKDKSIDDTGERMIPAYHKNHMVYGEHIVRYGAAVGLVKDKVVLDIASGTGYGTALLSSTAKKVYGVDVDKEAVAYAQKNYASSKTTFLLGDAIKIPLDDNSVDVVVSFETIEHVKDYKKFMDEVKRVLKKDGLLVLSTPNDVEFVEGNHFHLHEFEQKELEDLVKQYFSQTKPYFQATWLYNALLDEKSITQEWQRPIDTMQTAPLEMKQVLYFYMLCANRPITERVDELAAISEHWSHRSYLEHITFMQNHMEGQQKTIEDLKSEREMLRTELRHIEVQLNRMTKHVLVLPYRIARKVKRTVKRHIAPNDT